MIVSVADRTEAIDALQRAGLEALPALTDGQIVVQLSGAADAADITRILAHEGIFVTEIRPDVVTLEDAFLSLTDGLSTIHTPATPMVASIASSKDQQ